MIEFSNLLTLSQRLQPNPLIELIPLATELNKQIKKVDHESVHLPNKTINKHYENKFIIIPIITFAYLHTHVRFFNNVLQWYSAVERKDLWFTAGTYSLNLLKLYVRMQLLMLNLMISEPDPKVLRKNKQMVIDLSKNSARTQFGGRSFNR